MVRVEITRRDSVLPQETPHFPRDFDGFEPPKRFLHFSVAENRAMGLTLSIDGNEAARN